ncbi:MAG TPA: aromatic amino acid ammonia-lyase, partial [Rubrobacteraceae bacterium]|nr:aromatic amino acid ammonia-lyase [Rubrobacteraceae bacterium]
MKDASFATGFRLELDGGSLGVGDVVRVAREEAECVLSAGAVEKMEVSNRLKHALMGRGIPVYGVTTGFGDSANRQISPSRAAKLQQNQIRFLGNGVGPISPPEVTRATMLLRANCLAKGNSGVRPELVERLLFYLNNDVLPLIPERGSCGASGDLVPLSYVAAVLVGEEEVLHEGRSIDAAEVLAEHGLEPMVLEAKEGLALTNGTSFMSAFAALSAWDAAGLTLVADLCTAMTSEALLGNRGHFDAFLQEQKPHPGQVESARVIRDLLAGSGLSRDPEEVLSADALGERSFVELERRVQDRYSVRCAP